MKFEIIFEQSGEIIGVYLNPDNEKDKFLKIMDGCPLLELY